MKLENGLYVFSKSDKTKVSDHFNLNEFACLCKAIHDSFISEDLIILGENLRIFLNDLARETNSFINPKKEISISVTSGYRCPIHNKAIGGEKNSPHTQGLAMDIKINNFKNIRYDKLAMIAYNIGFKGIGIYKNRIHVDIRDGSKQGMGFALWPETEGLP